MDDEMLVVVGLLVLLVLLDRRAPVPSVSTSTQVALPDGSVVDLDPDPLPTYDSSAFRDALNSLLWR